MWQSPTDSHLATVIEVGVGAPPATPCSQELDLKDGGGGGGAGGNHQVQPSSMLSRRHTELAGWCACRWCTQQAATGLGCHSAVCGSPAQVTIEHNGCALTDRSSTTHGCNHSSSSTTGAAKQSSDDGTALTAATTTPHTYSLVSPYCSVACMNVVLQRFTINIWYLLINTTSPWVACQGTQVAAGCQTGRRHPRKGCRGGAAAGHAARPACLRERPAGCCCHS